MYNSVQRVIEKCIDEMTTTFKNCSLSLGDWEEGNIGLPR